MSISNATESAILALMFNATAWANYAQNGTSPETDIYVALHTADPGDAGTMATSEAAYTSYTRKNVVRTGAGWLVAGTAPCQATPVANINFPAGTGGGESVTHFSVGKSPISGANAILYSGSLSPGITTGSGITPSLTTATSIQLD